MTDFDWVPEGVDTTVPSVARAYDFMLGGAHNLAVDRAMATRAAELLPAAPRIVRINRAFLRRVVTHLVESGIDQFLDIGSGIPTAGNVHEVAPDAKVVYVDKDPVAVAHSELLLFGNENAIAVQGDLRDPAGLLSRPEVLGLLDFDRPVAVLMLMVLHFVPDEDEPWRLVAHYRDHVAPGSYLAVSHVTDDHQAEAMHGVARTAAQSRDSLSNRSYDEVARFFEGFELQEPGLTGCGLWRPQGRGDISHNADENTLIYAGLGLKPASGSR
ncbi:SAM-dependent methyltransferase [Actinosynnema sp. NPDC023587]|uniref:SAM-dependent methyltransferase n=1 Tax=Actinosynnema sp. NPDC023587 TaxID=3154695 RepID=UPI0033F87F23